MTDDPREPLDGNLGLCDPTVPDSAVGARDGEKPKARSPWALRTRVSVASLALIAMMFLFVFPTRSYLAQQRQVRRAEHSVAALRAQNEVLAREAERLQTPSEVERLAREQFNWVLPGEQAYSVGASPDAGSTTTTTNP